MSEVLAAGSAAALRKPTNRVLKKFLGNKSAVIGAVIVIFFVLIALLAPCLRPGWRPLTRSKPILWRCEKPRRPCTG